jgi:hypothetical protein
MTNETGVKPIWPPGSSLEQQFVLAVLGRQIPEREEAWRELLPHVNWPQLLEVTRPDLYPYLHFCLQTRVGAGFCPREVMRQLAASRQLTALRNLRRLAELREIQTALATQNIPILGLKGIVLAFVAYKDPSLRPMNDIDFFLDEKNVAAAARILGKLGYTCPDRLRGLHFEGEIKFQKRGAQSLVELHTQIELTAPTSAEHAADIWSRSVKLRISDFEVRTLSRQDFLFHLCLHMARRHCYATGFLPFVDILKWVETHEADWDWPSLIRTARSKKYQAYVDLTLDLASDFLGIPIPPFLVSNLPDVTVMKDIAWQQICDDRRVQNFVPIGLVELLNAGSVSSLLGALLNRLRPMQGNVRRSAADVSRHNFMALLRLLKALRAGNLSRTRVRRQVCLQQQREQLATLLRNRDRNPRDQVVSAQDTATPSSSLSPGT